VEAHVIRQRVPCPDDAEGVENLGIVREHQRPEAKLVALELSGQEYWLPWDFDVLLVRDLQRVLEDSLGHFARLSWLLGGEGSSAGRSPSCANLSHNSAHTGVSLQPSYDAGQ
jgi:hypothetical protein